MKFTTISVLAASLLLSVGCHTANQSHTAGESNAPRLPRGLHQASRDWDRFFNAGEVASLVELYAEDAISMPPNAPTLRGRKALRADFESFLTANVARHETYVDEFLRDGNLAIERARYRFTYRSRAGGAEKNESGRHVQIRRRIDGKWRIVLEIWNLDTPPTK